MPALSAYTQRDYEAIEAAVLESPRGRWFLGEFTRRNRAADTSMLLEAIRKLERNVAETAPDQTSEELSVELRDISEAIGSMLAVIREAPEHAAADVLIGLLRGTAEQLSEVKHQMDRLLSNQPTGTTVEDGPLTPENLAFFKGDEALFEAAPSPGLDTSPALTVVREEQGRALPAAKQAMRIEPAAAKLTSGYRGDAKDRIVFIRRATSSETSIPLTEEPENEAACSRPQPAS